MNIFCVVWHAPGMANFILLTAYLYIFHWNEMLAWWLPGCFVLSFFFAIILLRRKKMWLFYLIVFLLSCGCICYVALPRGDVGSSVVCNCGILVIPT